MVTDVPATFPAQAAVSPAITAVADGGYQMAFQANTGDLWTAGADNHGAWDIGIAAGTSPSIIN